MDNNFIKIAIIILIIDSIYLYTIGKALFVPAINRIQGNMINFDYRAAFLCYLLLAYGLYHFIIKGKKRPKEAFKLGLIIYGVYETTNMALFNEWKWDMVIVDSIWGGILFYLTTMVYYSISHL